jgi:hypothetical protein
VIERPYGLATGFKGAAGFEFEFEFEFGFGFEFEDDDENQCGRSGEGIRGRAANGEDREVETATLLEEVHCG